MMKNKNGRFRVTKANEFCCQEQEHYCVTIIEAIISNLALGSVNLSQLNVMICFDLNTVASH